MADQQLHCQLHNQRDLLKDLAASKAFHSPIEFEVSFRHIHLFNLGWCK